MCICTCSLCLSLNVHLHLHVRMQQHKPKHKLNLSLTIADCGEARDCDGASDRCLDRSNKRAWTLGRPSCRGVKATSQCSD